MLSSRDGHANHGTAMVAPPPAAVRRSARRTAARHGDDPSSAPPPCGTSVPVVATAETPAAMPMEGGMHARRPRSDFTSEPPFTARAGILS